MNYIHTSKNKNRIIKEIALALIPLLLYGIYKNGYLVYQKGLIPLKMVFMPLYLVIITTIIYELIYFLTK